jgi:predicted ATP-dependent endonuclease of OLD family
MTYHIVVEGPSDVVLLRELLRPDFDPEKHNIRIVEGGGWSGADSLARTILVVRKEPVVLVVDADTTVPERIREHQQFLDGSLGQVGARTPWRVFLAVPEIEALLFTDRQTLENLVGKRVSQEQFIRGQYEPRKVLDKLLSGQSYAQVFEQRLPQMDLSAVREQPLIRELKEFLAGVMQRAVA